MIERMGGQVHHFFLLLLSPCLLCSSAVGVLVALLVPITTVPVMLSSSGLLLTTVPVMLSSSGLLLTLYTDLVSFDLPNHYLTRSMSVVFRLSLVF